MVIKVAVPHQFKLKVIPDLKTLFFVDRKDIHYIGGSDILPAPLEAAAEKKAIKDLGTEKDENARKILIEHNLRLVVYIAKKFDNTGVGVEDLISIGTIGLIKAINTFNPDKNIKLATYASRCIENEILMYLRRNNKTRMEVSIDEPLNVDWDGNELLLSDILGTIKDLGTEKDENARKILIEHNLRLVVYIAKKFDNTGVGVEDLISIGTIGLIKAINTFNPDKNIKLATYASRCIENEILMYLRRNNKTRMEVSIDEPLNVDWDGNELLLSDILGTEEDAIYKDLENEVEKKVLIRAIGRLSGREQMIIRMRFGLGTEDGEEKTQKEVADMLGISQSYISRLEKKIMQRLRREMVKYS